MELPVYIQRIWNWITHQLVGLFPIFGLTIITVVCRHELPPWSLMCVTSFALYLGFKWLTWWQAVMSGLKTTVTRSLAYILLWPGMDARRFLDPKQHPKKPELQSFTWSLVAIILGASLIFGLAHFAGKGLLAGWIGIVGIIFLMHFGLFRLLALFWQQLGICAHPLMHLPPLPNSLGDFWGKRWNTAFRDLAYGLSFKPLRKRLGIASATMITFIGSGLIHDFVISFPARGGYGLPTLYFVIQGVGILLERSTFGIQFGLRGKVFALVIIIAPICAVFHPPFVIRVIVPLMQAMKAL